MLRLGSKHNSFRAANMKKRDRFAAGLNQRFANEWPPLTPSFSAKNKKEILLSTILVQQIQRKMACLKSDNDSVLQEPLSTSERSQNQGHQDSQIIVPGFWAELNVRKDLRSAGMRRPKETGTVLLCISYFFLKKKLLKWLFISHLSYAGSNDHKEDWMDWAAQVKLESK